MNLYYSAHQFYIHSDVFHESNEPVFDLHKMYPGRVRVVPGLYKLIFN